MLGHIRRWLCLLGVLGAAVGLTLAISAAPGWFRLPEQCLGFVIGVIPGLPEWVFDWVCPIMAWIMIGGLAGWAVDARAWTHVPKTRAGKIVGVALALVLIAGVVFGVGWAFRLTRWSVKIGTDVDVGLVDLDNPLRSDVATLAALPRPDTTPDTRRVVPVEATVYVVSATLVQFKREPDGDYHLVMLGENGGTMITEIPNPRFVPASGRFRDHIVKARAAFAARYHVTTSWHDLSVPVVVTGVGFFDRPHGQHRPAPNLIELHPVLDIQFP